MTKPREVTDQDRVGAMDKLINEVCRRGCDYYVKCPKRLVVEGDGWIVPWCILNEHWEKVYGVIKQVGGPEMARASFEGKLGVEAVRT